MAITIRDVAQASGSSVTTVSRVLSGSGYPVSKQMKGRILQAAKELNYTPNLAARSLKTSVGTEIAVIFPSIINPYYTTIIKGMEEKLFSTHLGMLVYITGKNGRAPGQLAEGLKSRHLAGVVAAMDSVDEVLFEQLCMLKRGGTPVLLLDYQRSSNQALYGVFYDYHKGAALAAEYLLRMGHRNIAFATTHLDRESRVHRYNGFCEGLLRGGVSFDENRLLVCASDSTYRAGVELAGQIKKTKGTVTAVAAINDIVAAGVVMGLTMRGIRVPEDISVMGFDNGDFAEISYPSLTTVNVPAEKMGTLAASSILAEIEGDPMVCSLFLEPSIVERKSVRRIR